MAYLSPRRALPALTVRGGVTVRRVLVERGRAVGVETAEGAGPGGGGGALRRRRRVAAPAAAVRGSAGLRPPPRRDRRRGRRARRGCGVHRPSATSTSASGPPARCRRRPLPLHGVLHATSAGSELPGDLEILPWLTPFSRITGGSRTDDELAIGAGLQREESRGRLTLDDGDPRRPPRLAYGYLTAEPDRRRLREARAPRGRAAAGAVAGRPWWRATNLPGRRAGRRPRARRLDPAPTWPPRSTSRHRADGAGLRSRGRRRPVAAGPRGRPACGSWTRRCMPRVHLARAGRDRRDAGRAGRRADALKSVAEREVGVVERVLEGHLDRDLDRYLHRAPVDRCGRPGRRGRGRVAGGGRRAGTAPPPVRRGSAAWRRARSVRRPGRRRRRRPGSASG